MISLENIESLSEFQRNAKTWIRKLKKSGQPAVLTVNGRAELVVLSADAFQKLLSELELAANLNAIHKGMMEAQRGEGMPADELIRRLRCAGKMRKSA